LTLDQETVLAHTDESCELELQVAIVCFGNAVLVVVTDPDLTAHHNNCWQPVAADQRVPLSRVEIGSASRLRDMAIPQHHGGLRYREGLLFWRECLELLSMGVERQIVVLFGTVFHLSTAVLSTRSQPSWVWKYALRSCSGQGEGRYQHVSLRLNSGESGRPGIPCICFMCTCVYAAWSPLFFV
jgi:hypothetical protein